jgi:hypothetical protein
MARPLLVFRKTQVAIKAREAPRRRRWRDPSELALLRDLRAGDARDVEVGAEYEAFKMKVRVSLRNLLR